MLKLYVNYQRTALRISNSQLGGWFDASTGSGQASLTTRFFLVQPRVAVHAVLGQAGRCAERVDGGAVTVSMAEACPERSRREDVEGAGRNKEEFGRMKDEKRRANEGRVVLFTLLDRFVPTAGNQPHLHSPTSGGFVQSGARSLRGKAARRIAGALRQSLSRQPY